MVNGGEMCRVSCAIDSASKVVCENRVKSASQALMVSTSDKLASGFDNKLFIVAMHVGNAQATDSSILSHERQEPEQARRRKRGEEKCKHSHTHTHTRYQKEVK